MCSFLVSIARNVLNGVVAGIRTSAPSGYSVDFRAGVISIPRTKSNHPHIVPMNATVQETFRDWRESTEEFEYVFVHTGTRHHGRPVGDYRKAFRNALKDAGIVDFRFHDLRHTFGSWLALAGVDLLTIKELMGHRTVTQTLRYAHLNRERTQDAVRTLNESVPHLCRSRATTQSKGTQKEAKTQA